MKFSFHKNSFIFILKQISHLPFGGVYFISDVLFFFVFHLFRYRRDVVAQNLKNSFPQKSEREIEEITLKFYRHLCDLILETIKAPGMREKDFQERMRVYNPELVNNYFSSGKSVVILTMHYNNWEWNSCLPLVLDHHFLAVYKPLHDSVFDKYINQSREKSGIEMVANSMVLRRLLKANHKNELVLTWLAADQTPPDYHKLWLKFMNQDTMFYPGPAYISKKFNFPVLYQEIRKISRGRYEMKFELLFDGPANYSETEIMETFISKMEATINRNPEYYLWSHKRWKHKRKRPVVK